MSDHQRWSRGDNDRYDAPQRGRKKSFVTKPPKASKGLTGKISTLFRREASRERQSRKVKQQSPPEDASFDYREYSQEEAIRPPRRLRNTPDDDDAVSVSSRASQRIFYSSHNDDDDDSYESRISSAMSRTYDDTTTTMNSKTIRRYRGFSTSIQSLFLDESLVCASMGCFGLVLSNRTEYLLQLRSERRAATSPRRSTAKLPSRLIAGGLVLLILGVASTFVVFGFGNGAGLANEYYQGYDYYDNEAYGDDANYNNNGVEWDDYLSNNNRNRYDDDGNQNGDDGNQNGDDGNQNAYGNDDGNGDDGNNNGDDAAYNYNYNGDDGGGNDDGQQQVDDQAQNDDGNQGDDYYGNNYGNDDGRRLQLAKTTNSHQCTGIFKLRDAQNIWTPLVDFVRDEWNRPDEPVNSNRDLQEEQQPQQQNYTDLASQIRMVLLFTFLLFLGILGRRRRMRTRFYLVRARAQEDHLYYASSKIGDSRKVKFQDTREDQYEGACSHTLCGCYPVDSATAIYEEDDVAVTDKGIVKGKAKRHHQDIVARAFECLTASCCGLFCKCWFQALSICALAQEAREIRLLVPPRYQRIDFITHQPFHEYQKSVNDLRLGWVGKARRKAGIMLHFDALSRLSRYIILTFTVTLTVIVATLCFNPNAAFSWQDAVVLTATFGISFLVIFVVHWIFHKSDLSLDAVIKLFAAGFCIAVPSAFVFEGLLVNTVLLGSWGVFATLTAIFGESFSDWVYENWRTIWILGEFFNAYVVAAVTEELCKYYTFRTIEHPDLLFLTGLNRFDQDESAVDGGLVQYPFASHQVEKLNRNNSFESAVSRESRRGRRMVAEDNDFEDDQPDVRTYRQKAMAITTGMICVAVGLACAENFLYVFLLGGATGNKSNVDEEDDHRTDVLEEWIVLFFRSVFPIHALAAALQSINMIRKFVESDSDGGHRIGVGRIILPAVIVHGSFDAVLMGINVYVETAWDRYREENNGNMPDGVPYNSVAVNLVAWLGITFIMLAGMAWYYRENRSQRLRLILLEEKEKAKREDPNWTPPPATRQDAEII